jgi:uncharacterized protein (DUF885 family)
MLIGRRDFLAGAGSAALCSAAAAKSPRPSSEARKLNALLDRIFERQLHEQPQNMTSLGLDKGKNAWARSQLDDQSSAQSARMTKLRRGWLAELHSIDRSRLTGLPASSYDCVEYDLTRALEAAEWRFGRPGFPQPYVLSQIGGTYQSVPDFLDTQHVIETPADAGAYLSRLHAFARGLDDESARAKSDAGAGIIPPDFVITTTLKQMRAVRSTPLEQSVLVTSLARRANAKGLKGDWRGRAAAILRSEVWPALDRQIQLLQSWQPRATHDAGVWRLPNGEAYYRFAARYQTTTTMKPEEIHTTGLQLVDELSVAADALFRANGLTSGTVGERYAALFKDPRFIYPNTEQGKAELLAYLNGRVKAVTERLPQYFGTLPKTGLEIRRVPPATEAGSPGGYYQDGSLDGSRPGAYYINLRDTAEVPRWTLPTLTYHEGIPGHHLQGALALESKDLPMLRRTLWFTAYGEGWALYSEQLADEMGLYRDDPWGRLGFIHDALFRAVRLVLDSGLHDKRWSRETAIAYFMEKMGDPEAVATTEVERYCVWPGQASSYMIGKMTWLKLRAAAQSRLGARFDIRKFHDVGLLTGAMPLAVLERHMGEWVEQSA